MSTPRSQTNLARADKPLTDYSIWTLAYCQADMPHDFFGGSGLMSNKGTVQIPMLYTVLVGGEVGGKRHVALVDAGFGNQEWMSRYNFFAWEDPLHVLGKVQIKPEDVDAILVTHLHFDHVGNFGAFPNAHLYIQLDEYMGWLRTLALPADFGGGQRAWLLSSLDPQDIHNVASAIALGKVTLIEGDAEVLPGITARLAKDSHTFGTQWFEVETLNGTFAIAGDAVYWYSNVEQMWPPGYNQGNPFNQLFTYDRIRRTLSSELERLIPGHDPLVWQRHRTWSAGPNQVAEVTLAKGQASKKPT
ncbi:MAG: N-acyl homoserine lactonase family protein [Candidatus Binatia bacterium]